MKSAIIARQTTLGRGTSRRPGAGTRPVNWAAWIATGTVVPPRQGAPSRVGGIVFLLVILLLIAGPMMLQVTR